MSVSIEVIEQYLQEASLEYECNLENDGILVWVSTIHYESMDGEKKLPISIQLSAEGRSCRISVLEGYEIHSISSPSAKLSFLMALNIFSFRTHTVQFKYWASTRSIHPTSIIALEDAELTYTQFRQCFFELVYVMEQYHSDILKTLTTGQVTLSSKKDQRLYLALRFGSALPDAAQIESQTAAEKTAEVEDAKDEDDIDEWL